jgi:hypothetical protein
MSKEQEILLRFINNSNTDKKNTAVPMYWAAVF